MAFLCVHTDIYPHKTALCGSHLIIYVLRDFYGIVIEV
jgi:hypothetical protein